MTWRVAKSIVTLRSQLDAAFPNRSKASDGTIGDAAHKAEGWENSDHNPWYPPPDGGIVTAVDITHDPAHGVDINQLSDQLVATRDSRIKYVIANRLILDSREADWPWQWRPYLGTDPHTNHLHLSVMDSPLCDDPRPWALPILGGDDVTPADIAAIAKAVADYKYTDEGYQNPVEYWRRFMRLEARVEQIAKKVGA